MNTHPSNAQDHPRAAGNRLVSGWRRLHRNAVPLLAALLAAAPPAWAQDAINVDPKGGVTIGGDLTASKTLHVGGAVKEHSQGAYLEWNKSGGQGETLLLNQRNMAPGGFIIGEVDPDDKVSPNVKIDGDGNVDIEANLNVVKNGQFGGDLATKGSLRADGDSLLFHNGTAVLRVDEKYAYIFPWGTGRESNVVVIGGAEWNKPVDLSVKGKCFAQDVSVAEKCTANAFITNSDERIKRREGRSDTRSDLSTLMGMEVTNFSYIDTVANGAAKQKKLIAQQVEKVFPQAVSQHTDVVPDIFRQADIKGDWINLATTLRKGDRVRLIGPKSQGIHEVLEVGDGRFRTDFAAEAGSVFVYGREVNDFRAVDYDAIAMLNVSATQQIKKEEDAEVKDLQQENADLRTRVTALEAKDQARDGKLAAIEKALLPSAKSAAALKIASGAE